MTKITLLLFFINFILTICQSQPSKICFMGDSNYGDLSQPFISNQDPRTLMGTFTQMTITNTESDLDIDFNLPIYKHTNYRESESNYIFKINIGWVLTANAAPNTASIDKIKLTCFEDNIIDCIKYRWFWGYNSNEFPILPVGITTGKCNTNICMDNFEMTIETENSVNTYTLNGFLTSKSPSEPCELDINVCISNRTYWINNDDTSYRWYYRLTKNANWVYGRSGSDRIACAPGYVESPLFCTTFVYASDTAIDGNYTNYTFRSGLCNPTQSPTTINNISNSITTCTHPFDDDLNVNETDIITRSCNFGSKGTQDKYKCLNDGTFLITKGCYLISFGDEFINFSNDIWTVIEPYYVNGKLALNMWDNNDIQFIPNNAALVNIIKSTNQIKYPLKLRTTILRKNNECNNWFIALGTSYEPRAKNSILVTYNCINNEASLYNSTYKLYDTNCWDYNEAINGSLDVTISTTNSLITVNFDTLSCADLILPVNDIQSNDIDAYIFIGSFKDNKYDYSNYKKVIGRFNDIFYTQFYCHFDGLNQFLWKSPGPNIDNDKRQTIMFTGESIISGSSFQFEIPFMIEMGIKRPWDNEDINHIIGRYAHFIVIGDDIYMNKTRDNVIQIVYDGYPKQRMIYTSYGIYVNSTGCKWNIYGKIFDITIQIDKNILS
eukprot:87139_1